MLGVVEIDRENTGSYGIVDIDRQATAALGDAQLFRAHGLVEKPAPVKAPSTLSIIGRYILQPEVFNLIENLKPGAGGEVQLTDAINAMIGKKEVYGFAFDGIRYDCGGLVGFIAANLAYGLSRQDIGSRVRDMAQQLLKAEKI